ncbi:MAG: hypothetical protein E7554_01195 [Ruminococcaceae bacterium]|nr:hypothetical protein [Oscillospiraceae bacterium]
MNCKFCGNFVPEGKDSCPVCGRRPDEEPIGKLLSENQPNTAMQTTEPAAAAAEPAEKQQKHPKGLFLPMLLIGISVAGWLYGLIADSKIIGSLWADLMGVMGLSKNSGYVIGEDISSLLPGALLIAGLAILLTIIGIIGVAMLIKRLINRVKY